MEKENYSLFFIDAYDLQTIAEEIAEEMRNHFI